MKPKERTGIILLSSGNPHVSKTTGQKKILSSGNSHVSETTREKRILKGCRFGKKNPKFLQMRANPEKGEGTKFGKPRTTKESLRAAN
jgi:hypothetical protein